MYDTELDAFIDGVNARIKSASVIDRAYVWTSILQSAVDSRERAIKAAADVPGTMQNMPKFENSADAFRWMGENKVDFNSQPAQQWLAQQAARRHDLVTQQGGAQADPFAGKTDEQVRTWFGGDMTRTQTPEAQRWLAQRLQRAQRDPSLYERFKSWAPGAWDKFVQSPYAPLAAAGAGAAGLYTMLGGGDEEKKKHYLRNMLIGGLAVPALYAGARWLGNKWQTAAPAPQPNQPAPQPNQPAPQPNQPAPQQNPAPQPNQQPPVVPTGPTVPE